MEKRTIFFWDGVFSQWHPSEFEEDGLVFTCAEQYMMYWKARLFKDEESVYLILGEDYPARMKQYGREVKNFEQDVWDMFKFEIVVKGNKLKLEQNDDIHLEAMGYDLFVEASPYDLIWGIGISEDDEDRKDQTKWRGLNLLGLAIEEAKRRI